MKWRRAAKKAVTYLLVAGVSACAVLLAVNGYIIWKVKDRIISPREAVELENVDCIMVLGCGVRQDGSPSGMLKDRLEEGIGLYKGGASDRLLMSGDHGRKDYDEVNLMKQYAVEAGIPSENIFMDHAGFSTYESMYRARDIFQVKKIVIVTQNYHMYRALFVARSMGMEAYGVASDPRSYGGQLLRDVRELLARPKDLIYTVVKPKPTYLGEAIPVNGNGNVTNDKEQEEGK
ncbi:SanA/YdcF family protein [Lacrimispora sp. 210928-DFI.3.58]|uniref:SanA/YdcF family protein n=1 Tax=Lacrimispora sp. 210928-DFI.3.58 TaxID=2883214 RepID=UPI0015B6C655|nr:ElyC/SanA/YdcF family protein [Lacrimispora sp. 210928-DFI.3.58]MCB7319186.1 YdcF family protein [Lacrimispora sp. 210928-DFI.3.58]